MSDEPSVRELAKMAQDFTKSRFGTWYLKQLDTAQNRLIETAMTDARTAEQKALCVEHAAGVKRGSNIIRELVEYAEHPELLEPPKDEQEPPMQEK